MPWIRHAGRSLRYDRPRTLTAGSEWHLTGQREAGQGDEHIVDRGRDRPNRERRAEADADIDPVEPPPGSLENLDIMRGDDDGLAA